MVSQLILGRGADFLTGEEKGGEKNGFSCRKGFTLP